MEQFSKEGRKLRPRKNSTGANSGSERVEYHSEPSRRSYSEHGASHGEFRPHSDGHRQDGEHRNYGSRPRPAEGRGYGSRPSGEHGSYGGHGADGEHRSYGGSRPSGGAHRQNGGTRNFTNRPRPAEGRTYQNGSSEGEHRSYGEGRPSSPDRRRTYGRGNSNGRGSFEGKKPYKRSNAPTFNKESDEGISRMISRRPLIENQQFSDNDCVPTLAKDEVRLNKFIANSGVCSRREADTLIQAGVVTVNGEVVTELGTKVNIFNDDIRFNGERLKGEEKVYIVMNKPAGYVTTASDPHAEKTVLDLLTGCKSRVYPVGRLDKNTTGVLMFTNDGEIAERLTHPSYDKKKIYQVILDRPLSEEDYSQILSGITLNDGDVKADELEYIEENDHRKLGIEIHSGKNRIVRRIFESLGYNVKALDRVYFAGLTKRGLKKGEWRYLSESEANILKMGAYV